MYNTTTGVVPTSPPLIKATTPFVGQEWHTLIIRIETRPLPRIDMYVNGTHTVNNMWFDVNKYAGDRDGVCYVGRGFSWESSSTAQFEGDIQTLLVYDKSLSLAELATLQNFLTEQRPVAPARQGPDSKKLAWIFSVHCHLPPRHILTLGPESL